MRIAVAGGTGTVGRHVVDAARRRGHEVTTLSRATGTDLTTGTGLVEALRGTDAVIDATSISTQSAKASETFFRTVTSHLLEAERSAGVDHHLALSIVGSDRAPFGYYAGKAAQERLVSAGGTPWTILRATQFHEFAAQIYRQIAFGPISLVPKMISQPVAARDVGLRLVELAEHGPSGHAPDLAGPEVLRMGDMVRDYARATGDTGPIWEVPLPGGFGRALRDGTLLAGPGATLGTQTFGDWIADITTRKDTA
ncbi:SDR family oxidoreductase [Cnuibacter physcomitrellae]|uniref:SDR family oxidoreductase n=1 Tax=Cnuibacter physcomitrellae TaxID=1619308 RepID=UPI002175CA11|nr:SDR family oxidoreductase [Cnuibacter physcomitrellae]MCS5497032.1 SDR family oxidoreductase [Cnuibacter physcomitrellae]